MKLVIVGARGQGRVVKAIAEACGHEIVGFVDDVEECLGTLSELSTIPHEGIFIGIGNNTTRKKVYLNLKEKGEHFPTLIHPTAVILGQVGQGTMVGPHAVIGANAKVKENCIINTHAVVEHDCIVEPHTHISICAAIAGNVTVGEEVLVGANACVLPQKKVGEKSTVGAGAVVTKDVPENTTVKGVPAK